MIGTAVDGYEEPFRPRNKQSAPKYLTVGLF